MSATPSTNMPDIWGEGAIFAFSGIDGDTDTSSGFTATCAADEYGLLFHTPRRRLLDIRVEGRRNVRIATGDVLVVDLADEEPLIVTYGAWHTLIGEAPEGVHLRLGFEDGSEADWRKPFWITEDSNNRDVLALIVRAGRFALSYGRDVDEARWRAASALEMSLPDEVSKRLAVYGRLPELQPPARDRLLKKCLSVMKVNTLSPERSIRQHWSTPDRVPHRHMWLWDTVFHSLAMNRILPEVSWRSLKSVLDTRREDGRIPHQASVGGETSAITQPPVLAWGVWENYEALRDESCLSYALPHLERYLEWDLANRDANGNGLLEWRIEANERSRSGESGMDNSPRFDEALLLDAVDFSTFAALDMAYTAQRIAGELGNSGRAKRWRAASRATSGKVQDLLWNEQEGFYCDREVKTGKFSPVKSVIGFLPLLLDDTPVRRVDRLVRALDDPDLFDTAFPVPSVAVSSPSWSTDMWRGATWINTNYLIHQGLLKHGKRAEADRLAEKTVATVLKYYESYGVVFEFYDSMDRVPPPACDRKGPYRGSYDIRRKMDSIRDYHWTAALTTCLLLEDDTSGSPDV